MDTSRPAPAAQQPHRRPARPPCTDARRGGRAGQAERKRWRAREERLAAKVRALELAPRLASRGGGGAAPRAGAGGMEADYVRVKDKLNDLQVSAAPARPLPPSY